MQGVEQQQQQQTGREREEGEEVSVKLKNINVTVTYLATSASSGFQAASGRHDLPFETTISQVRCGAEKHVSLHSRGHLLVQQHHQEKWNGTTS